MSHKSHQCVTNFDRVFEFYLVVRLTCMRLKTYGLANHSFYDIIMKSSNGYPIPQLLWLQFQFLRLKQMLKNTVKSKGHMLEDFIVVRYTEDYFNKSLYPSYHNISDI